MVEGANGKKKTKRKLNLEGGFGWDPFDESQG